MFKQLTIIIILIFIWQASPAMLRDPTRPADQYRDAEQPNSDFVVNSIVISANRRIAVIDNQIVSIGDTVGDFSVLRIDPNEVVLANAKRKLTLTMLPDIADRYKHNLMSHTQEIIPRAATLGANRDSHLSKHRVVNPSANPGVKVN